ncbi:MAG TPA: hypothetical protein IAA21_05345 [Candidatus Blautia faecigallinarum]|uniref:DUF5105 domain-containing protein n=1 Tax=Candidatus Blautia faecigallinarum TaxID=2838488 RepID=A0A9D2DS45_9FIRM|nr:hypothetical protein [Candidatus Blautia faecigallinarum]
MKITKRLLPLLLVILAVLGIGCSASDKAEAEEAIISELDLLKNLDTNTVQKYISYQALFPDASEDNVLSDEVNEVFSLFFQNFDYKILEIDVDKENKTAEASLRLTTLDAENLAKDFIKEELYQEILHSAAQTSQSTEENTSSLEERYMILHRLLSENTYDTIETDCTMSLYQEEKKDNWEINRTHSLENELVGGLITYLSDPDFLSPEDTLGVYLNSLKTMDIEEMSNYLGVGSILNTSDETRNAIASALVEEVHNCFNYEVIDTALDGYTATIETEITTFDSDSILSAYQEELDAYLSSPDAVIGGSQARYEKSYELLLDSIEKNDSVKTSPATFTMVNNGTKWELLNDNNELGNAIFGTLTTTPVSE